MKLRDIQIPDETVKRLFEEHIHMHSQIPFKKVLMQFRRDIKAKCRVEPTASQLTTEQQKTRAVRRAEKRHGK